MLVVLMALKTLELRARRDALVVFFLGFFLVLTHFLYSQSLAVAVAMLVSVWGLLTALVLAHMPVGKPSLRQAGGLAARTAAARRAGDGAAVPAVPAHRPAVGHAAGRHRADRACRARCAWARWPRWPTTTRSRCACASTAAAAARADVLPRPGADALRRHRVDARSACRSPRPALPDRRRRCSRAASRCATR